MQRVKVFVLEGISPGVGRMIKGYDVFGQAGWWWSVLSTGTCR
jgi:hypothetical protein